MSFRDSKFYRALAYLITLFGLFLSRLLKSIWVFFPGILFVVLAIWCFWTLGQGKDLIVAFTENNNAKVLFFIAIFFWVYVSWYSARIVAYLKENRQQGSSYELPPGYLKSFPRVIGFSCLLAIELAVLQSPILENPSSFGKAGLYFFTGLLISWGLDDILTNFANKHSGLTRILFYCLLGLFVLAVILVANQEHTPIMTLFWLLLLLHLVYLFYINLRRVILDKPEERKPPFVLFRWANQLADFLRITQVVYWVMDFLCVPRKERGYFRWFNFISIAGLVVYFMVINSIEMSWIIGPFPFVLIAFAVLLGFANVITALSVKAAINFHFLIFLLALCIGSAETHYIRQQPLANIPGQTNVQPHKNVYEFFNDWVNARKLEIDSVDDYPVYFVLANGGASRSGYWTASVLGKLEDTTAGKGTQLSRHLFCLSGTSGGGVGVATFFSLLQQRQQISNSLQVSYLNSAKAFLKKDYLTYTLAHMLGPDYFKYILHINSSFDRAGALEETFEQGAAGCADTLKAPMGTSFSKMAAFRGDSLYGLPVLCINTTQMQDGNPGVVSNIRLDEKIFNSRIDVMDVLNRNNSDIHLSTASIMGARFPYLSPAGRIDEIIPWSRRVNKDDSLIARYFVDGGYFDNSGAGVVQEMMRAMLQYSQNSTDSAFKNRVKKLHFIVLHITNSPQGVSVIDPVKPIKNDLLAPVLTIVGAYDMQTTVNDQRLKNYILDISHSGICKTAEYYPLHLYKDGTERKQGDTLPEAPYAMNWFISDTTLRRMDKRLLTQPYLNSLITKLVR